MNNELINIASILNNQLKVINSCLTNLQQDLGGEIGKDNDYISIALKSCRVSKDMLNEILDIESKSYDNPQGVQIACKNRDEC